MGFDDFTITVVSLTSICFLEILNMDKCTISLIFKRKPVSLDKFLFGKTQKHPYCSLKHRLIQPSAHHFYENGSIKITLSRFRHRTPFFIPLIFFPFLHGITTTGSSGSRVNYTVNSPASFNIHSQLNIQFCFPL